MMSTFSFLCVISLLLATSNAQTQINVVDTIIHSDVYRLGLNIGGRDTGSHMMKNMINNGGFEAREKATIMLADATSTTTVFVQAGWSTSAAQPNGFWDDASFIFLTGANQGVSGTITSFAQQGGKNTFTLSETLASAPQASDVMAVRSQFSSSFPHSDPRPNSVGKQSRVIDANAETPKRWNVMYDGGYRDIDYTLGRSLLINGSWTLNFWVKGNGAGEKFSFFFGRETWAGGAAFFSKTYTLNNTTWQEITEHFTISAENSDKPYFPTEPCQNWPSCQRPLVEISISKADGTSVLIDDLSLVQDGDTNPTIFTDRVVNLLKEYNPGVLRYWGGQLGASLKSELDYDFAKTTHGYKPTDDSLSEFTFSLHDFLVLCKEVGADPWYVVPPTFFPDEAQGLIEYLNGSPSSNWGSWRITRGQTEAWTSVFKNIYLEYGNELWGGGGPSDPFGGASMGGANLGKAANFTFHKMRQSSFFSDQIKLVIGGQAGWSGQNDYIESNADQHDILALAPYFGNLQVHDTVENSYGPLYAFPVQERITGNTNQTAKILADKGHGTTLALYEINFHYTDASEGTPPPSVRNPWMTGVAGGINLPWSMLNYLQYYGAQPSCAFSFLGYSFLYSGAAFPAQCDYPDCSFARVWGLMRDLSGLGTKRPTWLASTLVNRAMFSKLISTSQSGDNPAWTQSAINSIVAEMSVPYINSFAFSSGNGQWSLVVFNLHVSQALNIVVNTPTTPSSNLNLYQLSSTNPTDGNEVSDSVSISMQVKSDFASGYSLTLPPHSVSSLVWTDQSYIPPTSSPASSPRSSTPTGTTSNSITAWILLSPAVWIAGAWFNLL